MTNTENYLGFYKNGKPIQYHDCCEKCTHFISNGFTVDEMHKEYQNSQYADVVVGYCPKHNPEEEKWGTCVSCFDFDNYWDKNA